MPPNRLFRHFRASTGVCDVARFQKTAEKWNRATFTGHRTCQSGRRHATMARKTRPRLHPFHLFDVPALPYQEQEPRIPKTSAFRSKQFPSRYEKGDIAKASTHTNRKRPRQRPRFMMLLASKIHQNIRSFSQEGISRD